MKKVFFRIFCIILLCLFSFNKITYAMSCSDLGDLQTDLNNFFNFFKAIVPLLVIGLSSYDFIKAITNKDDKDIKKAFSRLLKRLICAVILFFLPVLIELLLSFIIDNADVCIGK